MLRDAFGPTTTRHRDGSGARVPNGRLAAADDVARLVLYLASDDSAYSTGSEFVVDGGMSVRHL